MQYKILQPIRHNGAILSPGEEAELFDEFAAKLIEQGAIEPLHRPFVKRNETGLVLDVEAIQAQ